MSETPDDVVLPASSVLRDASAAVEKWDTESGTHALWAEADRIAATGAGLRTLGRHGVADCCDAIATLLRGLACLAGKTDVTTARAYLAMSLEGLAEAVGDAPVLPTRTGDTVIVPHLGKIS